MQQLKRYPLPMLIIYLLLLGAACLHASLITTESVLQSTSDHLFSYGFVGFLLACAFLMSWANITSFEDLQRRKNETTVHFSFICGINIAIASIMLILTAAFI